MTWPEDEKKGAFGSKDEPPFPPKEVPFSASNRFRLHAFASIRLPTSTSHLLTASNSATLIAHGKKLTWIVFAVCTWPHSTFVAPLSRHLAISLFGTIAALTFLPLAYRDYSRLPERTRDKILKTVQQDLFGEQQPGTAFIVKNTGKNEKYKYVAFLSLVRVADVPHPVEFAYTALRGLLLSVLEFNQKKEGPSIEVIAIPSFALNNSPEHKRYVLAILPIGESRSNFWLPTAK